MGWMLIKNAIENEKDDLVNMSVSSIRNAHFARSGACFRRPNYLKKRFKITDSIWGGIFNGFGLHFRGRVGAKKHKKSMPKFDGALNSIWETTINKKNKRNHENECFVYTKHSF